jgi:hypothetical protein
MALSPLSIATHSSAATASRQPLRLSPWASVCLRLLLVAVFVAPASGCQMIIGVLMMLRGRPLIEADFKQQTGKDMMDEGKRVIVLCTSPDKAKAEYSGIDIDLSTEITRRLKYEKIKIVDEHSVATWMDDQGGQIDDESIAKAIRKFKADYVILIELEEFAYHEENSRELFRGRSRGTAHVIVLKQVKSADKDKDTETKEKAVTRVPKRIYSRDFSSTYPVHQPVQSDSVSELAFRKQYVDRMADELARLFYDHRPGEDF